MDTRNIRGRPILPSSPSSHCSPQGIPLSHLFFSSSGLWGVGKKGRLGRGSADRSTRRSRQWGSGTCNCGRSSRRGSRCNRPGPRTQRMHWRSTGTSRPLWRAVDRWTSSSRDKQQAASVASNLSHKRVEGWSWTGQADWRGWLGHPPPPWRGAEDVGQTPPGPAIDLGPKRRTAPK